MSDADIDKIKLEAQLELLKELLEIVIDKNNVYDAMFDDARRRGSSFTDQYFGAADAYSDMIDYISDRIEALKNNE